MVKLRKRVRLTDAWFPLRDHAQQSKAWRSDARFINLACGRGSGKTELARRWIVRQLPVKKAWPDPLYFFALPTIAQAKRVGWEKLDALIPRSWLAKPPNRTDLYWETIFGSKLVLLGMDKPQRAEGVQYDGGVIDESCDQRPKMFDLTFIPALTHRRGRVWRIGVPKRFGVGAGEFKDFFDRGLREECFEGTSDRIESYQWASSTVLTPEELAYARATFDEKDFEEQFNASWENAAGAVYYNFSDQEGHNVDSSVAYDSDRPIIVGSDFNVDPMSWVLGQEFGNELHVFDEIYRSNTNTPDTLDYLYKERGAAHHGAWEFYGDASSRQRRSSATMSDYAHIFNDGRFKRKTVKYPGRNPPLADRYSAVNGFIKSADNVRRLKIHPRCKNLIRDLNVRAYKENERVTDDSDKTVGHISDALGYIIYTKYPPILRIPKRVTKVIVA